MFIRDDGSRSYKIFYGVGMAIQLLILKPISLVFIYIGKLALAVAKSVHNRLVSWLSLIVFLAILSLIAYLLKIK